MGRNIDSQVSDEYQEDRPWLESDQRRKTKCFPLRGVDKPKSCRRWSPVRVVFTRTTSIFQPAIRNNLGIRFERERRARFSTLERWVVPFERWSKDRSILDKRVYKNSSLEIASIVWHQGTNHLWRCGAAGITSSSWKPARDTGTCAPADLFWISSVRGRAICDLGLGDPIQIFDDQRFLFDRWCALEDVRWWCVRVTCDTEVCDECDGKKDSSPRRRIPATGWRCCRLSTCSRFLGGRISDSLCARCYFFLSFIS